MYAQPLVALRKTNVKAEPFVETVRSEPAPLMFELFLPTVKLFVAKVPNPSIIVTSSPTDGDEGSVSVTTPAVVSIIT